MRKRGITSVAGSWPWLALTVGLLVPLTTSGQNSEPDAAPSLGEDTMDAASPRASVARFLELCRARAFDAAAAFLALPPQTAERGPELARRLKAVLDAHIWLDLDTISGDPRGNVNDGLPAGVDEIARVPGGSSPGEPVRVTRSAKADRRWLFSGGTVARIDSWYERLDHRWALEHLPPLLLSPGPHEVLYWQWLALPLGLLSCWVLGVGLSRLSMAILKRLTRRTRSAWDDAIVQRMGGPVTLWWTLGVAALGLPLLGLYVPAEQFVLNAMKGAFLAGLFWALFRTTDIAVSLLTRGPWAGEQLQSSALIPLGARVVKVALSAIAVVSMLSQLGYPVTSLVAGLGIGGLALALAAQKTVENLFGAFSIGADQPFREGDFVRIEDFVGTVERIGLRSTKIRTLDRTLVTIPNGKLADMRLESFTARDRIRLACNVGLVYQTRAAQLRSVLAGLERTLREHPKIWPDAVVVRFSGFGESSLDIEVMAWFMVIDWSEFQVIREEILISFMEVVERAGTSLAYPTHTIELTTRAAPVAGESARDEPGTSSSERPGRPAGT